MRWRPRARGAVYVPSCAGVRGHVLVAAAAGDAVGAVAHSGNRIGDVGVRALAAALEKNSALVSLNLQGALAPVVARARVVLRVCVWCFAVRVHGADCAAAAGCAANDSPGNNIGTDGARALGAAVDKTTTLTALDLRDNHLATAHLESLEVRLWLPNRAQAGGRGAAASPPVAAASAGSSVGAAASRRVNLVAPVVPAAAAAAALHVASPSRSPHLAEAAASGGSGGGGQGRRPLARRAFGSIPAMRASPGLSPPGDRGVFRFAFVAYSDGRS